jgi:hypothetical protein
MENSPKYKDILVYEYKAAAGFPRGRHDMYVPISRILYPSPCGNERQSFIWDMCYHIPQAALQGLRQGTALHRSKDLAVAPTTLPSWLILLRGCSLISLRASLFAPRGLLRTGITRYPAVRLRGPVFGLSSECIAAPAIVWYMCSIIPFLAYFRKNYTISQTPATQASSFFTSISFCFSYVMIFE